MRTITAVLVMTCVLGCDDFRDATSTSRKPVAPPGIASMADVEAVDVAAGAVRPAAGNGEKPKVTPPKKPADRKADDGKGIIGKMTNEVFDLKKAQAENPNLKVVDDPYKAKGSDPVSFAASAYINKRSQASQFGFQRALQLFQATNDRHPTYDEFKRMMKENRVEFTMLPHYRKYAYDAKEGKIVVLQDASKR